MKAAIVYIITKELPALPLLIAGIERHQYKGISNTQTMSYGFVPAVQVEGAPLVQLMHDGKIVEVCLRTDTRSIDKARLIRLTDERLRQLEEAGEQLTKAMRDDVKENVIATLLPETEPKTRLDRALLLPEAGLFVVLSSNRNDAEAMINALRIAAKTFPVQVPPVEVSPKVGMAQWLYWDEEKGDRLPPGLCFSQKASLYDVGFTPHPKITFDGMDVDDSSFREFMHERGVQRAKKAWFFVNHLCSFALDDDFRFTGITPDDRIVDRRNAFAADAEEELDYRTQEHEASRILDVAMITEIYGRVVVGLGGYADGNGPVFQSLDASDIEAQLVVARAMLDEALKGAKIVVHECSESDS